MPSRLQANWLPPYPFHPKPSQKFTRADSEGLETAPPAVSTPSQTSVRGFRGCVSNRFESWDFRVLWGFFPRAAQLTDPICWGFAPVPQTLPKRQGALFDLNQATTSIFSSKGQNLPYSGVCQKILCWLQRSSTKKKMTNRNLPS